MRKQVNIKNFFFLFIALLFLLYVNTKIANGPIGTFFEENSLRTINGLLILAGIFEGIVVGYGFILYLVKKLCHRVWLKTVSTTRSGVKENIQQDLLGHQDEDKNSWIVLNYLIYASSVETSPIAQKLLHMLKDTFEQGKNQDEVSYFFMANRKNNSVSTFLNSESDFKFRCEQYSYSVSKRYTYNSVNMSESKIDIYKFRVMVHELLHMSLYDTPSSKEDDIQYFRKLFAWMDSIKGDVGFSGYMREVFLLLQALPCIQQKFNSHNMRDKLVLAKIANIQHSRLAKTAFKYANKTLRESEGIPLEDYARSMGLILAYPEEFGLRQRIGLCYAIEKRRGHYEKMYHEQYIHTIALLLSAVPLKCEDIPNSDVIDMLFTIMNGVSEVKEVR